MFITIFTLILCLGYLLFVIFETIRCNKNRKKIKYVVHINGIRGKSTTTRLIDAGIRGCGLKVFSKTTGTIPTMINIDNVDVPIKRLGSANIREQVDMINKAAACNADVLVLECMAVNPELQRICEEKIVKANVCVITNVREDHLTDMGNTLEDIADAFCGTIPSNGTLVIGKSEFEKKFDKEAKKKNSKCIVVNDYDGDDLGTFRENIALAFGVCDALGLDREKFYEGMKKYHPDFGAFSATKKNNTIFLNGLSINDPDSIKIVYEEVLKKYDKNNLTILLNNRNDRPSRVIQHIELIKKLECKNVYIYGSNPKYVVKEINKTNPDKQVYILDKIEELEKEEVVFAIGNIGGKGMKIIEYFQDGEKLW